MNELLYRLNTEDSETLNLSFEDTEKLEAIFREALRTPVNYVGFCPFCNAGDARRHADGVWHCGECDTTWIDDSDFQRLTESEEARATRLAGEYQAAHSEPFFGLAGDGDA